MRLPTIVVFDNIYISFLIFKSYMVFSRGFAVTFVIVTMVLKLNLGFSHGCDIGFRSLDLLVLVNHNYNIVTLV